MDAGTSGAKWLRMAHTHHAHDGNGHTHATMGDAERAVYELVGKGSVDTRHGALYRRQITALSKAGLIRKRADGVYEHTPHEAPPAEPEGVPMGTLTVRVPQEILDTLDGLGLGTRSDAARVVLGRGLVGLSVTLKRAAGGSH